VYIIDTVVVVVVVVVIVTQLLVSLKYTEFSETRGSYVKHSEIL